MSAKDTLTTPRPLPNRTVPVLAGSAAVVLALPLFLLAGFPLAGWLVGAALWALAQGAGVLLARLPLGADNLAASGVVGFGMMVRAVAVLVALIALATVEPALALAAALVYAAGYTVEIVLNVVLYLHGEPAA